MNVGNVEKAYQLEDEAGSRHDGNAAGAADAVREGGAAGCPVRTAAAGGRKGRRGKASDKIQAVIRFAGGVSWIAGIYILECMAAGVDQGIISGWRLAGMALAGIACLALTAVASRIEGEGEE